MIARSRRVIGSLTRDITTKVSKCRSTSSPIHIRNGINLHQPSHPTLSYVAERNSSFMTNLLGGVFGSSNPLIEGIDMQKNPMDFAAVKPSHYPKAAKHFQSEYMKELTILEERLVKESYIIEYETIVPQLEKITRKLSTLKNIISLMSCINKDPVTQRHLQEANSTIQMNHEKSRVIYNGLLTLYNSVTAIESSSEKNRVLQILLRPYRLNGMSLDDDETKQQVELASKRLMDTEARFLQRSSLNMEEHGKVAPVQEIVQFMYQILVLRAHVINLLGYDNYAAYSLERHGAMAKNMEEIKAVHQVFADAAVEKLSSDKFQSELLEMLSDSQIGDMREYFEMNAVLEGLFDVLQRLFGIAIVEDNSVVGWNRDVRYFHIHLKNGNVIASFYIDPYRRLFKDTGCFMAPIQYKNGSDRPILALSFDFKAPMWDDDPSQLNLADVVNIFHEFGHLIQHSLTSVQLGAFAGAQTIEEDASEVFSQLMEHILFEGDLLKKISKHYQTGDSIPEKVLITIKNCRLANKRNELLHRLFLGELELSLSSSFDPQGDESIISLQRRIAEMYCPHHLPPKGNIDPLVELFQSNALGKCTMQYRYLWSEIISSDIYLNILSKEGGSKILLDDILSKGSPLAASLRKLLGRDVDYRILLSKYGL